VNADMNFVETVFKIGIPRNLVKVNLVILEGILEGRPLNDVLIAEFLLKRTKDVLI